MYKHFIYFLLALSITSGLSANNSWLDNYYYSTEEARLEVGYATGDYISIDEDYTEIAVFSPIRNTIFEHPFIDVRNYIFNNGKYAANIGFGVRHKLCMCDAAVGINTYYDYRRGNTKHSFNQWGVGLEYLDPNYDMRLNTYWVFDNNRHNSNRTRLVANGSTFASERLLEYAYSGFDAEFGKKLFSYADFDLYAAAGPYYYTRSRIENFWGGFGRVELNWNSMVSLQVRVSHDDVNSTRVQGMIEVSIPLYQFCPCSVEESCVDWLVIQPVRRNGIILTDHVWH
ncbi:MAG: inverse autotransporter beta domain-containing protein [Parachlamydiales bacterium]|jgi:hypothetical protein